MWIFRTPEFEFPKIGLLLRYIIKLGAEETIATAAGPNRSSIDSFVFLFFAGSEYWNMCIATIVAEMANLRNADNFVEFCVHFGDFGFSY